MSIKSLNAYLFFDGTCEKAIKLYESALGAKAEGVMRYSEIPGNTPAPENKDRIIHALLHLGGGSVMVGDSMPGTVHSTTTNVHVCLGYDDPAEMARAFDALSVGGKVEMAIHDAFWGAKFGTLRDAFGIEWMFTCDTKKG